MKASKSCTVLGMTLSGKNGLKDHIESNRDLAIVHIGKIARFGELSMKTKMLMYKALVRSRLTYPSVILSAIDNRKHLQEPQKEQNLALRKLSKTHWREFNTAKDLHNECKIETINQFLHKTCCKTWQKIQDLLPDKYEPLNLTPIQHADPRFPSSLAKTQTDPEPQYMNYVDRTGVRRN